MWFSLTFPVCSKFPDFSLTGKCLPIFPGFPVRVGTLYNVTHCLWNRLVWMSTTGPPPWRLNPFTRSISEKPAIVLAILFSLKTMKSLENRLQTHSSMTPLFSMRTESLSSWQKSTNLCGLFWQELERDLFWKRDIIGYHNTIWKSSHWIFSCTFACTYTLALDRSQSWSQYWFNHTGFLWDRDRMNGLYGFMSKLSHCIWTWTGANTYCPRLFWSRSRYSLSTSELAIRSS